jgi:integrase
MFRRDPSYRLHKQSGQAIVTLADGMGGRRDVLLGKHGTPEESPDSWAKYYRVLTEWKTNGRALKLPQEGADTGPTVAEVLLAYWRWAEAYYLDPEGGPGRELENIQLALRPARKLYALTPAAAFDSLALRAVRDDMIRSGLSRGVVNARVHRIRRAFRWAASFKLIPAGVYAELITVEALKEGRCAAREAPAVLPAAAEHVEAALPYLPAPVAALVKLQLLTGCRAGEAMVMRAIDISMIGEVWAYRPHRHKNKHRGKDRVVYLGPQAREVIRPFLTTDLHAYIFSPAAYVRDLRERRAAARKSKRTPSELRHRTRRKQPKRVPADRYDRRSYRQAVVRACDKANVAALKARGIDPAAEDAPRLVPRWSPLQLRHTAATAVRARFGVEAAKVILGHSRVETAQIYAEKDEARARQIAGEIG